MRRLKEGPVRPGWADADACGVDERLVVEADDADEEDEEEQINGELRRDFVPSHPPDGCTKAYILLTGKRTSDGKGE